MPCGGCGCPPWVGPVGPAFGTGAGPVSGVGSTFGTSTVTCGSSGRFTLGRLGTAGATVCTTYGVGTGSFGRPAATVLITWLATLAVSPACGMIRYLYSMVPAVAGAVNVQAADLPNCRSRFCPKNVTDTSV
jgi:hypothetical protein